MEPELQAATMLCCLRLREIEVSPVEHPVQPTDRHSEWKVEMLSDRRSASFTLRAPFSASTTSADDADQALAWYLEEYTRKPFERGKADAAAEALSAYGQDLAAQIVQSGLSLPTGGHLKLEIEARHCLAGPAGVVDASRRSMQQLHWEVLEDVTVWPQGYRFKSVGISRLVPPSIEAAPMDMRIPSAAWSRRKARFRILLVVCRPDMGADLDHQLVSRCLVTIIGNVAQLCPDAVPSLKIVRPSTWEAFRQALHEYEDGYDLVHFDVHGIIKDASTPQARAGLVFCRADRRDALRTKKVFRSGDEIGLELARARVKMVILNACRSADYQSSTLKGNLAEVLLGYGVQSVLAMAYKVVEEAVEVFMNVFYHALLVQRLSVQDAAQMSRLALMKSRSRRALYMQSVQLSDHIVPILYASYSQPEPADIMTGEGQQRRLSLESITAPTGLRPVASLEKVATDIDIHVKQELMGRGYDILCLEQLLSTNRLVLLHGQGGCGKSELLHYLRRWWKSSGWIKGSACVDFANDEGSSLVDCIHQIGQQLGVGPGTASESEIIGKLQTGRYLVVFDSVDVMDTSILRDAKVTTKELPAQLRAFIDAATRGETMVIVSSRQATVQIANITTDYQKYHLTGLTVLESMNLLQHLAFETKANMPTSYHRRENIDFLRRVVILLEGNPAAIRMVIPTLKQAKYDGEVMLNKLLYGVCETSDDGWKTSRFARSVDHALEPLSLLTLAETLVLVSHLAVFWTLMPLDLTYYYCFSNLHDGEDLAFKTWTAKGFEDAIKASELATELRIRWPRIESKLIRAGVIDHAVVKVKNGSSMACFHVHPILTLMGRPSLTEDGLRVAKFAYVRQMLLWSNVHARKDIRNFVSSEWDGAEQNEDLVHNMRAVTMAWAAEGDFEAEEKMHGISMFHLTFTMSLDSLYNNQRHMILLVPILRNYLSQLYKFIRIERPGCIPTSSDVGLILSYAWEICRFDTDDQRKAPIVASALQAVEKCRSSSPTDFVMMAELAWYQLRHAEANIAETNSTGTIYKAKQMYERNLADDPSPSNHTLHNSIRRVHLQNLTRWASCVTGISLEKGGIEQRDIANDQQAIWEEIGIGESKKFPSKFLIDNKEVLETMRVRDQFHHVILQEAEVVSKFGNLAKGILDAPLFDVFADHVNLSDPSQDGDFTKFTRWIRERAKNEEGQSGLSEMQTMYEGMEYAFQMMSGNTKAAESALDVMFQREAPSATASTRWESLASYHMMMYSTAVAEKPKPDYKKALTHLEEWWKQHQGVGMAKLQLCYGHMKFATCYDALDRVADAARAVITCDKVYTTMTDADCAEGSNTTLLGEFLLDMFAKLDAFRNPMTIASGTVGAAGLSLSEVIYIYRIVKRSQALIKMRNRFQSELDEARACLRELSSRKAQIENHDLDEAQ